jgi:hypothetical protein
MRRFLPLAVAFSMIAVTGDEQTDAAQGDSQSTSASVAQAPSAAEAPGVERDRELSDPRGDQPAS